ncbi:uncharacterized protein [Dysidea avara]|uniref:uncharacterized protein isoform X1 n=2 Tax=Dysidea avara TaxID=196820 RepID=UPI00332C071E
MNMVNARPPRSVKMKDLRWICSSRYSQTVPLANSVKMKPAKKKHDRPSKVAEAPEPTNKQLELVTRQPSHPTQTNDKSKLATETKQLPQETPEPKLSWMGVQHTVKIPEKVIFTPPANKTQPAVAATSSSHYGPALPSAIKGNKGSSDSSDDEIVEVKKKHKKKHKKQVKQHKSHKRKHKHM